MIEFEIPPEHCDPEGFCAIYVQSELPGIPLGVTLDGMTQDGYEFDPLIVIDGTAVDAGSGLTVDGAGVTLRALTIRRFPGSGITVLGDDTTIVESEILQNGGAGIHLQAARATIHRNIVAGNATVGIDGALGAPGAKITSNVLEDNAMEGMVIRGTGMDISVNNFLDNGTGVPNGGMRTEGTSGDNAGLVFFHNALIENLGGAARLAADDALVSENYINNNQGGEPVAALQVVRPGRRSNPERCYQQHRRWGYRLR